MESVEEAKNWLNRITSGGMCQEGFDCIWEALTELEAAREVVKAFEDYDQWLSGLEETTYGGLPEGDRLYATLLSKHIKHKEVVGDE